MPSPQPGLAGAAGERSCLQQHQSPRQGGLWGSTEELPDTAAACSCCTGQVNHQHEHQGPLWENMHSAAPRGSGIHLTLQIAFTQLDEGIVDDGECLRGQGTGWHKPGLQKPGRKTRAVDMALHCSLPPSPLLKWQFFMHGGGELCIPGMSPIVGTTSIALLSATAKSSLECSQPKAVLTQFSTAEKTWEGQSFHKLTCTYK